MNIGIITGASSGMGRLFALYASHFYPDIDELWIIGRNIKRLSKVSMKIDTSSCIFPIDITKQSDVNVLVEELKRVNPSVKLLVNCAGLGIIGNFLELSHDDIHNMVSVNCEALVMISRICLDYMTKESTIINVASAAAFAPQPEFQLYAASKSFVKSFSQALRYELKGKNIHVTTVCPGCVDTPFFDTAQKYNAIKPYKKKFMANDRKVVLKAYRDAKKHKAYSVYGIWMKLLMVTCKVIPSSIIMRFV